MSNGEEIFAAAPVFEKGSTSVVGAVVRRPESLIPVDSVNYSFVASSFEGSPGFKSRSRREEDPFVFSEETAFAAVRDGIDPREVEEAFNEADVAWAQEAGRVQSDRRTG